MASRTLKLTIDAPKPTLFEDACMNGYEFEVHVTFEDYHEALKFFNKARAKGIKCYINKYDRLWHIYEHHNDE